MTESLQLLKILVPRPEARVCSHRRYFITKNSCFLLAKVSFSVYFQKGIITGSSRFACPLHYSYICCLPTFHTNNQQKRVHREISCIRMKMQPTFLVSGGRSGVFLSSKNAWKRLFPSSSVKSWPSTARAVKISPLNIASRWLSSGLGSQPSLLQGNSNMR